MFGISVNDVPGWLVAMPHRAIGVPVAFTPGLVPHCDVLTVVLHELAAGLLAGAAGRGAAAASCQCSHSDCRDQRDICPHTRCASLHSHLSPPPGSEGKI